MIMRPHDAILLLTFSQYQLGRCRCCGRARCTPVQVLWNSSQSTCQSRIGQTQFSAEACGKCLQPNLVYFHFHVRNDLSNTTECKSLIMLHPDKPDKRHPDTQSQEQMQLGGSYTHPCVKVRSAKPCQVKPASICSVLPASCQAPTDPMVYH